MNIQNSIKLILIFLFLLCLADMPYGYYELVRYLGMIGFAMFAIKASDQGMKTEMFIYIALALLFQPIFKIALGRVLWNIVDVLVSIGLFLSIFIKPSSEKS